MKKLVFLLILALLPCVMSACSSAPKDEPIVKENQKLIVPPNFGQMPK